jgi:hypothetical protein
MDAWFVAHLTDLFDACGVLEKEERFVRTIECTIWNSGIGLREFTLLNYGQMLMSDSGLWQVGADYLGHCPVQGIEMLKKVHVAYCLRYFLVHCTHSVRIRNHAPQDSAHLRTL